MHANAKRPRAIIYARFSPRPNSDECESSDAQIEELRRLCKARGYRTAENRIFRDDGISGGTVKRPGLRAAMRCAQRGMIFVCRDCKRLGRGLGTFRVVEKLLARGVKIESVADGEFSATDTSKFVVWCMKIVMGSVERIDGAKRTSTRMNWRQYDKHQRMSSRLAYGFKIDPNSPLSQREIKPRVDGTIGEPQPIGTMPDEHERAMLQRMIALEAAGNGASAIARILNEEAETDPAKSCRGGLWYKGSIARWLQPGSPQRAMVGA